MAAAETETGVMKALQTLSPKEAHALRYHQKAKAADLSVEKANELYQLYLNGKDCDEIRRLNPGLSLGAIVHARIRDDWDLKREQHQQQLVEYAAPRVMQVQLETSQFLSDVLAAAVKLHWDKIKLYLQDGNTAHLEGTPLQEMSFKKLADIISTLQQVTGQDKKKVVEHRGGVTVSHTARKVNQEEAAEVLEILALEPEKS